MRPMAIGVEERELICEIFGRSTIRRTWWLMGWEGWQKGIKKTARIDHWSTTEAPRPSTYSSTNPNCLLHWTLYEAPWPRVQPLQVTQCLLPHRSCFFCRALIMEVGPCYSFTPSPVSSHLGWNLTLSSLVDLKDTTLLSSPLGHLA